MKPLLPIAAFCALIILSCTKSHQPSSLIICPPPNTPPFFKWVKVDGVFGKNTNTVMASPDSLTLLSLQGLKYFVNVNNVKRSEGTFKSDTAQIPTTGLVLLFSNNPVLSSGISMPSRLHYSTSGDSIFLRTDSTPTGITTYTFVRSY